MKILKVMLTAIILSLILSLIFSIINYTPLEERAADTYYFSVGESFIYILFWATPILILLSFIVYFVYLILGKTGRLSRTPKSIITILIVGALTSITFFLLNQSNETNDLYLIPEGYEGDVFVFYNIDGAPKIETEDGFEVHKINGNGYFVTSTPDMDYGTVTDQYFYVDEEGKRAPISEKCISLFGTGGYSTSENEEIDLIYTGFRLTKDNCGEEFMTESFNMEESKENMINEILKIYYGIEFY
jgi:hypothetical protein